MSALAPPVYATPQAAAAATRKFKALVAYLVSSGVQDTSDPHPIIANATVADFNRALEEATRKTKCPLAATYARWGNGQPFALGVSSIEFKPFREVRYVGMNILNHRSGFSCYAYNAVEMLQVCYRQTTMGGKVVVIYHVQSMICNETPSYYRITGGARGGAIESCVRLLDLPSGKYSVKRNPTGSISQEARDALIKHKKIEDVDPLSIPFHRLVLSFRS